MTLDTLPLPPATEPAEPAEPAAPAGPSARPVVTPREAWRKAKLPVLLGVLFLLIGFLYAVTADRARVGRLDPDATEAQGALALATILREHGVEVVRVDAPTGAADTTVFVPAPDLTHELRPGALRSARLARSLVVAEPSEVPLELMDVDVSAGGPPMEDEVVDPGCAHPDAAAAGDALMGGVPLASGESSTVCYADRGDAFFVELTDGARRITVLGSGSFMTNQHLDDDGNAALAMRLLTRHPRLEWVYPRTSERSYGDRPASIFDLLPHRVVVLAAQLLVVVLLLALWRARRLGPVVVEPLPVVVRAAEAVEGRARLYEGAHARGQAATALQAGLRDRLVRVLGLTPDASPETMVAAITARTGRDAVSVGTLLYGPPPADDESLVRLAADLDQLDNEVRAL